MNKREINACIGQTLLIHGVKHLCIAAKDNALLLLQLSGAGEPLFKAGDPVQYIVATYPAIYNDELVWGQGAYFPLLQYLDAESPSDAALRDAALALSDIPLYVAMADDALGARCIGVFTRRISAEYALEKLINCDMVVMELAREHEKACFSYSEYRVLYDTHSLENCYWIEERRANHPAE